MRSRKPSALGRIERVSTRMWSKEHAVHISLHGRGVYLKPASLFLVHSPTTGKAVVFQLKETPFTGGPGLGLSSCAEWPSLSLEETVQNKPGKWEASLRYLFQLVVRH